MPFTQIKTLESAILGVTDEEMAYLADSISVITHETIFIHDTNASAKTTQIDNNNYNKFTNDTETTLNNNKNNTNNNDKVYKKKHQHHEQKIRFNISADHTNVPQTGEVYSASTNNRILFDTACSRNMSGVSGRLHNVTKPPTSTTVTGFNKATETVDSVGINEDCKTELYLPNMPNNLVLLSGYDYAKEGAAVLTAKGGNVYKLSEAEVANLFDFLQQFPTTKKLKVINKIFEIDESPGSYSDCCYNSTATKYFNTKVNTSNITETILSLLLTGLTFRDLLQMTKHKSTIGLPREI